MHDPTPNPFDAPRHTTPPAPLRVVVADDNPVVRAGLTTLLSGREDITVVAEAVDGRSAWEATHEHRPDVVLLDVRMPGVDGISALPHLVGMAPVLMLTYSHEAEMIQEALSRGALGYLVYGEFTADQLVAAVRDSTEGKAHFTPTAAGALLARLRQERDFGQGRGQTPGPAAGPLPGGPHGLPAHHVVSPAPCGERPAAPEDMPRMPPGPGRSSPGWGGDRPAAVDRSRFQLSTREVEIMDLIASGMTNQQIAATCFIAEKTVKNHINRIFAKLHSTRRSEAVAKWLGTAPGPTSRGLR
ncbi:response regulator transcription factor [Streptomyces sp. Caat 7-52]|uniref:response regulator transcription factor n=1 Tax=Streptomyces sp. Caat 7-52 TaxID=2949637 RepID=UPI0020358F4A|nr:response regulator transcription factor [Streptomyces sp. Caat 7-52]